MWGSLIAGNFNPRNSANVNDNWHPNDRNSNIGVLPLVVSQEIYRSIGVVCFVVFIQPPSILPISWSISWRVRYLPLEIAWVSLANRRRTLRRSTLILMVWRVFSFSGETGTKNRSSRISKTVLSNRSPRLYRWVLGKEGSVSAIARYNAYSLVNMGISGPNSIVGVCVCVCVTLPC